MSNPDDMLNEMWEMQRALNNYTLKSNGFTHTFDEIPADKKLQEEWVKNYTLAMRQECSELFDSTNWKWWRTKVDLFDEQNVKVELIDILHFWMSACMVMGLEPEDVLRMYKQKNEVNYNRQKSGYIKKDENDSRHI
ncbi:MAG: dUTPase [Planctomycetes bacterium]|nr:dUTPase [Planctomycetota bacterium]